MFGAIVLTTLTLVRIILPIALLLLVGTLVERGDWQLIISDQ